MIGPVVVNEDGQRFASKMGAGQGGAGPVSDGITEALRDSERYFERMRARLLREKALYGVWDPNECPHRIPPGHDGDDWCACGGPCTAMWCEGCSANLPEWGAWRAGLTETMEAARHFREMGNLKRIAKAIDAVCAAGWSP